MNDIIKTINTRISTLIAEMKARSKEILSLERAKVVLERGTGSATAITRVRGVTTLDKPMKAPRKPRRTKKHRTRAGLLKGRILTLLRMNRATALELAKQLETASFPFATGTNHIGCVRACVVTAKGKGILTSTYVPGRGKVYSLARHKAKGIPYVDHTTTADGEGVAAMPTANKQLTAQTRPSQFGLTDRIVKVLADEGTIGLGLTANGIIRKMEVNGFKFTAVSPQKSVTGLLSGLLKKNMVSRRKPYNGEAYHYKIHTTTELLDAVKEEV